MQYDPINGMKKVLLYVDFSIKFVYGPIMQRRDGGYCVFVFE